MGYTSVILFLSDKSTPYIVEQYQKLESVRSKNTDIYYLYHQHGDTIPKEVKETNYYAFTDEVLTELGYIPLENSLLPGSNHFPLLRFYAENPQYDYYWLVEDDVCFTGEWNIFFNSFKRNKSDFLSSYIRFYEEEPYWYWWWSLRTPAQLEKKDLLRSFNPVYRLSNKALQCLDFAYKNNWSGHHEVTIPTIIYHCGLKIRDFGGSGSFVPRNWRNRFYTPESMWYQPIALGERENTLYHPIKE